MIYLASPYTDKDPLVMKWRFEKACVAAARLMERGEVVFSPIAHSHPIAQHMKPGMDVAGDFWQAQDAPYVEACSRIVVLKLPGWEKSNGVTHEIARFKERGISTEYMDWE